MKPAPSNDGKARRKKRDVPGDVALEDFDDQDTALRFLEARWGKRGSGDRAAGVESRWLLLEAARLWVTLAKEPEIDRATTARLKGVYETLKNPAKKLRGSSIDLRAALVWVRERAAGSTRQLEYEVYLRPHSPAWRFRRTVPEREIQGLHSADYELPSSKVIEEAVLVALAAWESEFNVNPDKQEDLRMRLEVWCRRFFTLKVDRGHYLTTDTLLLIVLSEAAAAFGFSTAPNAQETRALALIATEEERRAVSSTGSDPGSETDRWRKAIAALPRWRAQMESATPSSG